MRLNDLHGAAGSKRGKRRVGRGSSSGWGKTAGRGQKGQNSRSGGGVRVGFEGGQLPLQKRIPTFGFRSRLGMTTAEVRLGELVAIEGDTVNLDSLRAANVIRNDKRRARIILSGTLDRPLHVKGANIKVTRGARAAIEAAGGSVEESS